jgi:hypothetical protein
MLNARVSATALGWLAGDLLRRGEETWEFTSPFRPNSVVAWSKSGQRWRKSKEEEALRGGGE